MKNWKLAICACIIGLFCNAQKLSKDEIAKKEIAQQIDQWHLAAAKTDFEKYFGLMTSDAVFVGTDATEHWDLEAFKTFAKPYFDKGKAWSFVSLKKNIYVDLKSNLAWFDELLDTQMKICRGSGVLRKEKSGWKIVHYVLSMTIPNDLTTEVVSKKSALENLILQDLKK